MKESFVTNVQDSRKTVTKTEVSVTNLFLKRFLQKRFMYCLTFKIITLRPETA